MIAITVPGGTELPLESEKKGAARPLLEFGNKLYHMDETVHATSALANWSTLQETAEKIWFHM